MSNTPRSQNFAALLGTWKNLDVRQLKLHWLSVVCSLVATGCGVYAAWYPDHPDQDSILRLLVTVAMGIALFLLPTLIFAEAREAKKRIYTLAVLASFMLLYVFFSRGWSNVFFFYKTLQGFVLAHLLVSLAPYFRDRSQDEKEFWSANWFLLNRFHMAVTQSVLLLIGFSLALVSIKHLFGIEIEGEVFGSAAVIIIFFVSVILFVGSLGDRKEIVEPAEILKRLVRTVLTPLAVAYFAILYAYGIKVVVLREWPRGGIGLMVSGLALIITLSYVIMRPIATSEEFGPRLKAFWNWSFRLLIGPVLLLMLGLCRRVADYGWSEQRAALGYLALWMLGIGIYYWHSNRRRLVGIPLSLAFVLAVTWFGPLSPTFIGEKSQSSRLAVLLAQDRAKLTFAEKKSINSILRTLCEANGVDVMAKAAGVNVQIALKAESVKAFGGYGSTNFARLCDDNYQVNPPAPGPLSQALTQLAVRKIDRYAVGEQTEDFNFNRSSGENVYFEKLEIAMFRFDDWRNPDGTAVDSYVEKQHGRVKIRFRQKPASLEWEVTKGVWRKLDLAPAIAYIKGVREKQASPEENSVGLRVVDTHLGQRLELQITAARFIEGNFDHIGSIDFTTLVERSRPSK